MSVINPYFTFGGNCREAMLFYRQCFGGELLFQTVGEISVPGKMTKGVKNLILQATLTKGKMVIMGSDMVPENGLIRGNDVAIVLHPESREELDNWYKQLSAGGEVTYPLQQTHWGAMFGAVTDKFGNQWLFSYKK